MDAATVSTKYQIVIPRKTREQYDVKPGYKVVFIPFEKSLDMGGALLSADLFNERSMTPPRIGDEITISFPVDACWLM